MQAGRFLLLTTILILASWSESYSQQYHPLPEANAYWTVNEFDESSWTYDDIVFSVDGDTIINGLKYIKVFRLNDYPTVYDTVSTLHCFMRQDIPARKVYFIRHYLGETEEKLGYDFSAEIGDTLIFPAFDYGTVGDSIFTREEGYSDSIQLLNGEYRKMYFYSSPYSSFNHVITFIEGIGDYNSIFPDRISGYDAFHQSLSICVQVNGEFTWSWYSPADSSICGFNYLGLNETPKGSGLSVYPNPANSSTFATFPVMDEIRALTLADLLGKVVLNYAIAPGKSSCVLDVARFVPGIYILGFKTSSSGFKTKLVITN